MIIHIHDKDGCEVRSVYIESRPDNAALDGSDDHRVTIECGGEPVVIDKCYGPTIACEVRVRFESRECEWVVERQAITRVLDTGPGPKGDDGMTDVAEWREVVRFDGQDDGATRLIEHDEATLTRIVFDHGEACGVDAEDRSPTEVLTILEDRHKVLAEILREIADACPDLRSRDFMHEMPETLRGLLLMYREHRDAHVAAMTAFGHDWAREGTMSFPKKLAATRAFEELIVTRATKALDVLTKAHGVLRAHLVKTPDPDFRVVDDGVWAMREAMRLLGGDP